jgi:hypothetical protein
MNHEWTEDIEKFSEHFYNVMGVLATARLGKEEFGMPYINFLIRRGAIPLVWREFFLNGVDDVDAIDLWKDDIAPNNQRIFELQEEYENILNSYRKINSYT